MYITKLRNHAHYRQCDLITQRKFYTALVSDML